MLSSVPFVSFTTPEKNFSFGIVADIHADLIPDKLSRLSKFISEAQQNHLEFIIQLGDFCFPKIQNRDFMNLWNEFQGPKYHVLGNHDMDVSSKSQTRDFWHMEQNFYTFETSHFTGIVLDANFLYQDGKFLDYDHANFYVNSAFRTFIHPDQIDWLKEKIMQINRPVIVFTHQSLCNPIWGIKNRLAVQKILEKHAQRIPIICFNGHDHIDYYRQINGVHYFELNSMSYQWLGDKYIDKSRYPKKLYEQYPNLGHLAPYKDPLYAQVNIKSGKLKITGKKSEWISPSPAELGVPLQVEGARASPLVSDLSIDWSTLKD